MKTPILAALAFLALALALAACAPAPVQDAAAMHHPDHPQMTAAEHAAMHEHEHAAMHGHDPASAHGHQPDAREPVSLPPALREHTLANMREHLAAIAEIQAALGAGAFDRAGEVAERRLGLSSLDAHGAHEVGPYMPAGMQNLGVAMHRAASRFALQAANAGATGDARTAQAALAGVTAQCVACHAAYRFQ